MLGARTGAWAKNGAPLPYLRRVAYVESKSDRGQYIDTGYVVGYDDEVDIEMMPLSYGAVVDYFFGSSIAWNNMFNASVRGNAHYVLGAWFGNNGDKNIITYNAQTGVKFHFNFSKNGVFFNGVRYFDSGNYFDSVNTCILFSKHTDINISPFYGKKGFGITLSKNLRNSDNKIGLYDKVTKQFFTNQGTGEFLGG